MNFQSYKRDSSITRNQFKYYSEYIMEDQKNNETHKSPNSSDSVKATIFHTCSLIQTCFKNNNYDEISTYILELSRLIRNESFDEIPGLEKFDVPNILLTIFYDISKEGLNDRKAIRIAAINCLVNLSSYEQAESFFDSEQFCSILLISIRKEKVQSSLEILASLLANILTYKNRNIYNYFLNNHIIKILTIRSYRSSNLDFKFLCFDSLKMICSFPLNNSQVELIYRFIGDFLSKSEELSKDNYDLMLLRIIQVFHSLLENDSIYFELFESLNFHSIVFLAITKEFNLAARFGCRVAKMLVKKYSCINYFPVEKLITLLVNNYTYTDSESTKILFDLTNTISTIIKKSDNCDNLINLELIKGFLDLAQNSTILLRVGVIKIIKNLIKFLNESTFQFLLTVVNNQNIFDILAEMVETQDKDVVLNVLKMCILIFEKSTPLNLLNDCIMLFQKSFSPDFLKFCEEFEDSYINARLSILKNYVTK
ncbi:hypothetical protein TRFO_12433 [Tritrichomonas foetus]|uniref:Armadillo repeat-containing domain-containing protein n=1 Tax=Tritrichomonas foetus TaxID=1144522 RepID=A0A1J4L5L1_9EUKA|nr:hypothetical protein TRFO_12433 [Tritrichomonas foetus]|eukprot:OHT17300.1 hypothetical protein TRFO_12433 [Tritrichomonas foetus]